MKVVGLVRGTDNTADQRTSALVAALGGSLRGYAESLPEGTDLVVQANYRDSRGLVEACEAGIPALILEQTCWVAPGTERRGHNCSLSWNGLTGGGWWPADLPDRGNWRPELLPWRDPASGVITIFGQLPGDRSLRGADIEAWMDEAYATLRCLYPTQKVEVRPHPLTLQDPASIEPLAECFARTSLAVTYNSTTGAEAVIQGIPTIACHPGSLARPAAVSSLLACPECPDRDDWLHVLATRHATLEAMRRGDLNSAVLASFEEAAARAKAGYYEHPRLLNKKKL